ncbi:hypothetical protein B2A_12436 [mine drainage metagenome]|uniref:Uncharacterized protein n=1 Tax=mine drainage metagenome TaxID=410659 RepID=T0YIU1_9ZZZZ
MAKVEDTIQDSVLDYVISKYEKELDSSVSEYPYFDIYGSLMKEQPQMFWKDVLLWFSFERKLPNGKTPLEEFADAKITDEKERAMLYNLKNMVHGEFEVVVVNGNVVSLKSENGEIYDTLFYDDGNFYTKGMYLKTRLYKFGEFYRFGGISVAAIRTEDFVKMQADMLMNSWQEHEIGRFEDIIIRPFTNLQVVLNKYPFQWVDGIYSNLGLSGDRLKDKKVKSIVSVLTSEKVSQIIRALPSDSKEALKIIIKDGGLTKWPNIKNFSHDDSFFWNETKPKSVIGILRLNALIIVGKCWFGSKKYKIAAIPSDIVEYAKHALEDESSLNNLNKDT